MSTILDALRKIEEERRSRTADVRSRLLLSSPFKATLPSQLPQAQRKTRLALPLLLGCILVGGIAGASFLLRRSQPDAIPPARDSMPRPTAPTRTPAPTTSSSIPAKAAPTPRTAAVAPLVAPAPPPQQQTSPQPSASTPVREHVPPIPVATLPTPEATQPPSPPHGSAVQRSPFTPPPLPTPPKEVAARPRVMVGAVSSEPPATESAAVREWRQRHQQPSPARTAPPDTKEVPTGDPSSATGTTLSMLQWSSDPEKRIAFIRVNGGPLTMAHEGDTIGGYKVVSIQQNGVELQSGEARLMLPVR